MTEPTAPYLTKDAWIASVAEIGDLDLSAVTSDARLVEDLGFDSVAVAELVVYLVVDCDMEPIAENLESRTWTSVTVGDLYAEYRRHVTARRRVG